MTNDVKRRSSTATDPLSRQLVAISFSPERGTIHVVRFTVFS